MSNTERHVSLLLWMEERQIYHTRLAVLLGVSDTFARVMLKRDTIPVKRHRQLVALGIPHELLPKPITPVMGRPRKDIPVLPTCPLVPQAPSQPNTQ